jgi:hypothetical protein
VKVVNRFRSLERHSMRLIRWQRATVTIGLLTLTIVALTAGCGGEERLSKAEYERRVTAVGGRLLVAGAAVTASRDDVRERVREYRGVARRSADELAGLKPPEEAESANERLVEGLRALDDELDAVLRELPSTGGAQAHAILKAALADSTAFRTIDAGLGDLAAKGYEVR